MEHAVRNQRKGYIYELRYELCKTNPEIAIFGSSRAKYHYNSAIIQKVTGQKTVNLGQGSSNIFLHYILLKTLLLHHTPKVVVLDVKPGDFDEGTYLNELDRLYPMVHEIAFSDDDLNAISPFEKIKLRSAAYRYNNKVFEILYNSRGKWMSDSTFNGFHPLPVDHQIIDSSPRYDTALNQDIFKYLPLFIKLCRQSNIKLIVCISPAYAKVIFDKTIAMTETTCRQNSIDYVNYLNNQLLTLPRDVYNDEYHLNTIGADKFTTDFAKRLLSLIK